MKHLHYNQQPLETINRRWTGLSIGIGALTLGGLGGGYALAGGGSKKGQVQNPGLANYLNMIQPGQQSLMNFGQQRLGANPASFYPDIMKQGEAALQPSLTATTSGANPYNALKENLLGEFDRAFQQYTMNPAIEASKARGTYTGGQNANMLGNVGTQGAQQRATLGSQVDVQALQNQQQAANQALQYGLGEFNIGNTATVTDPISAMSAAANMNPGLDAYSGTGIPISSVTPQQAQNGIPTLSQENLGALTSLLGPDLLNAIFSQGGGATALNNLNVPKMQGALGPQGFGYTNPYASAYNPFATSASLQ